MSKTSREPAPNPFDGTDHVTDPKMVEALRRAILRLMQQFPQLEAVNIQCLYRDATNHLRFHGEVGIDPTWTNSHDTLARILKDAVPLQRLAWTKPEGLVKIDPAVARVRQPYQH